MKLRDTSGYFVSKSDDIIYFLEYRFFSSFLKTGDDSSFSQLNQSRRKIIIQSNLSTLYTLERRNGSNELGTRGKFEC